MSTFKCKMCGGTLEIQSGSTVAECEYCGAKQTLPRLDDERRANLYDRANHFRRNNEFDKATAIYEQILNEDNTDAEAYWSLVLCRYGIEYVEDPLSHRRVPTVHRAQFTSVFDDDNYKMALQNADMYQKTIYEEEAKAINEIQKGILAISQKEDPFDVFICYKETDDSGKRTPDSVLANDLYYQLTQEGFKVFFARITLEDKLGTAYEPYIFAALNSAKVMVVLGTKPQYFNAVWVKNEWSRYLSLIKQGAKKMLIPAYKDMDPYDLPEEFSHLQAQDMSKLGFMQDLIRGIKKIVGKDKPEKVVTERVIVENRSQNTSPLLRRAFLFCEDGNFESAYEYAEKVLDQDPECAEAYFVKLLVELKLKTPSELKTYKTPVSSSPNYQKALRFASEEYKAVLEGYNDAIINGLKRAHDEEIYSMGEKYVLQNLFDQAIECFQQITDYKDAAKRIEECRNLKEQAELEQVYVRATVLMSNKRYDEAIEVFNQITNYKDALQKIEDCKQLKIAEVYLQGETLMNMVDYDGAIELFSSISSYKDSLQKIEDCKALKEKAHKNSIYLRALGRVTSQTAPEADITKSIEELQGLGEFRDASQRVVALNKRLEKMRVEKEQAAIRAEEERRTRERLAELKRIQAEKAAKKAKKAAAIGIPGVVALAAKLVRARLLKSVRKARTTVV